MIIQALNLVNSALEFGQKHQQNNCNLFMAVLEREGCLGQLEELQEHDEEEVYQLSLEVIKKHFNYEPHEF